MINPVAKMNEVLDELVSKIDEVADTIVSSEDDNITEIVAHNGKGFSISIRPIKLTDGSVCVVQSTEHISLLPVDATLFAQVTEVVKSKDITKLVNVPKIGLLVNKRVRGVDKLSIGHFSAVNATIETLATIVANWNPNGSSTVEINAVDFNHCKMTLDSKDSSTVFEIADNIVTINDNVMPPISMDYLELDGYIKKLKGEETPQEQQAAGF